ncbi:MAG TPA: porin [Candidatus Methylomirabilis sp.]|nr:porin [Candidatus Methylomirabilis sp.]
MRNPVLTLGLAILLIGIPSKLPAADRLDDLERALEAQKQTIELLQQEINALKQERARQQALEKEVEGLKQAQRESQQLSREVEQLKATAKPKFEAGFDKWQPYVRSTDGSFKLIPTGRIHVDFRAYEAGARNLPVPPATTGTDLTNNFLVRRGRIGLLGTFYKYFDFFVEADFAQGSAVLTDGYLDIHYWPELRLRAGQFKIPFSYEELLSDNSIDFVERSVADNLTPGRDLGAMLHGSLFGGVISYAGGIFNGSGQNTADTNDSKDVAARLVVYPFKQTDLALLRNLHVGADVAWGDQDSGQSLRGRTDGAFVFFNRINTRGDRLRYSGEVAYYTGPFTLYGEYIQSEEERKGLGTGGRDLPDLFGRGWYVTTTYMLTGETKVPGQTVVPNRWATPVGPEPGWGAWELAARFAQLDFRARDITGNRVNALTLGVNWYLTPNVKWLFNFVQNWFSDENRSEIIGEDASWEILTRLQLWF